jgi:hypothetical protein
MVNPFTITKIDPAKAVKVVIIIIVIVVVLAVMWKIYKASKTAGTVAGDLAEDKIIAEETGIAKQRVMVVKDVATRLVANIDSPWWKFGIEDIDEDAWANQLKRLLNASEAKLCSNIYSDLRGGKSLKADVDSAFKDSWDRDKLNGVRMEVLNNLY